ncbi:hypothetical protein [Actinobacillus delphinicola]|uniref:hypothetical protein n=1 Tax=Actinobacillus delphinicola TaxID=51161 RepID=UPI000F836905|nr:hypothetical protein [Actinobacillus delphinicola]
MTSIEYAMLAIVFTIFIAIYLINKDGLSGLMLRKGNDVTDVAITQLGGNANQGKSYQPIAEKEICIKHVPDGFSADDFPCMTKNPFFDSTIIKQEAEKIEHLKKVKKLINNKQVKDLLLQCWNKPSFQEFWSCVTSHIKKQIKDFNERTKNKIKDAADKVKDWFQNIFIIRPKYDLPHKP